MKYQQHIEALVTIVNNIHTKINNLAGKITQYKNALTNNNRQDTANLHHDIEANNEIIEDISDTIHHLCQQQREIIIHNFNLRALIKENTTP